MYRNYIKKTIRLSNYQELIAAASPNNTFVCTDRHRNRRRRGLQGYSNLFEDLFDPPEYICNTGTHEQYVMMR